jgi:succinylglutamate desuccinylase
MNIEGVTTINGSKSGITLAIIAGVHGNEICGIEAIKQILPTITIKAGRVHFIYGNPRAIKKNVRQVDMNLNRAFQQDNQLSDDEKRSYERKRALELMPILDRCEAILDIHSSATRATTPFVICEPHSFLLLGNYHFLSFLTVGTKYNLGEQITI